MWLQPGLLRIHAQVLDQSGPPVDAQLFQHLSIRVVPGELGKDTFSEYEDPAVADIAHMGIPAAEEQHG